MSGYYACVIIMHVWYLHLLGCANARLDMKLSQSIMTIMCVWYYICTGYNLSHMVVPMDVWSIKIVQSEWCVYAQGFCKCKAATVAARNQLNEVPTMCIQQSSINTLSSKIYIIPVPSERPATASITAITPKCILLSSKQSLIYWTVVLW